MVVRRLDNDVDKRPREDSGLAVELARCPLVVNERDVVYIVTNPEPEVTRLGGGKVGKRDRRPTVPGSGGRRREPCDGLDQVGRVAGSANGVRVWEMAQSAGGGALRPLIVQLLNNDLKDVN